MGGRQRYIPEERQTCRQIPSQRQTSTNNTETGRDRPERERKRVTDRDMQAETGQSQTGR